MWIHLFTLKVIAEIYTVPKAENFNSPFKGLHSVRVVRENQQTIHYEAHTENHQVTQDVQLKIKNKLTAFTGSKSYE